MITGTLVISIILVSIAGFFGYRLYKGASEAFPLFILNGLNMAYWINILVTELSK